MTHHPLDLPDVFRLASGARVHTPQDWVQRRGELRALLLDLVYGPLPPAPTATHWDFLHSAGTRSDDARLHGTSLMTGRIRFEGTDAAPFCLQIWLPQGVGPFSVLLTGDACWYYATDDVKARVLARGYALAMFNRVELAADPEAQAGWQRPASGFASHGAIAAWAWGYHRCVDVLRGMEAIRADQIAVVGHSRGGKASVLAGATDERIALTSANNSGAAGAGSFHHLGEGAEGLTDIVTAFPHWFGPRLADFAGQEASLPLDLHYLKALIAPRALLTTEALGDLWANPHGTRLTYEAAREVFAWLDAEDRIALHEREGGHAHLLPDWEALLGFADRIFNKNSQKSASSLHSLLLNK